MKFLKVKNLKVSFSLYKKILQAVKDVSFDLFKNEVLGIVGESGCGKSVLSQSIVKLLPTLSTIYEGEVFFENEDLFKKSKKEISSFRGKKIAYIFQEPMSCLNPTIKIGKQILEAMEKKSKEKVYKLLNDVGIKKSKMAFSKYPFELSGGEKQRIMIAMALAMKPKILIADEPTTALDVTIQAQILNLLMKIKKDIGFSIIFISHDLNVVSSLADRILVMYAGKIVEEGSSFDIMNSPKHPYTKLLLDSIPRINSSSKELKIIKEKPLDIFEEEKGCDFAKRCPFVKSKCFNKKPKYFLKNKQKILCFLYE